LGPGRGHQANSQDEDYGEVVDDVWSRAQAEALAVANTRRKSRRCYQDESRETV